MKGRLPSYLLGLLVIASIAAIYVCIERLGPQQTLTDRTVTVVLDGPPVAVFDTGKDSCELIDIPDASARAFRDYQGAVHLIASHWVLRENSGPTLDSV